MNKTEYLCRNLLHPVQFSEIIKEKSKTGVLCKKKKTEKDIPVNFLLLLFVSNQHHHHRHHHQQRWSEPGTHILGRQTHKRNPWNFVGSNTLPTSSVCFAPSRSSIQVDKQRTFSHSQQLNPTHGIQGNKRSIKRNPPRPRSTSLRD